MKIFFFFLFLISLQIYYSQTQITNLSKNTSATLNRNSVTVILEAAKDSIPSLGSFIISHKNKIVFENYFNGADKETSFDTKSVTKSITSAFVGILIDNGLMPDLNTPILSILPEYKSSISKHNNIWYPDFVKAQDSLRELLTITHLLTMQTGFSWDDNNPLIHRAFQCSSNPTQFMMDLPFDEIPGTTFKYCTGACQLISAILNKTTNKNLKFHVDSLLFKPLGIYIYSWPEDPQGNLAGGSTLNMKPIDMLKFGLLYLNNGNYNGRQIVSEKWVKESTSAKVELNEWDVLPNANGYGYYWWRRKIVNHQAYVASGYGGQLICVIPDLELVIVTTCFINDKNRGRSEIKRLHFFIDKIAKLLV